MTPLLWIWFLVEIRRDRDFCPLEDLRGRHQILEDENLRFGLISVMNNEGFKLTLVVEIEDQLLQVVHSCPCLVGAEGFEPPTRCL